jgi:hypothetical protein
MSINQPATGMRETTEEYLTRILGDSDALKVLSD